MGKGARRRSASIDNGSGFLKAKGRISRKRVGTTGLGRGQGQGTGSAMQDSPEHSSPAGNGVGMGGEEYDTWTDLNSRTSSSASTLSGCLSPILAEAETDEPEKGGIACSTSPQLYPSQPSTRSPALGTGGNCPTVESPMTDMSRAISLGESGHSQPPQIKCNGYPFMPGPKTEGSYCGPLYVQHSMGMLRHHTHMETIQENKPTSFQRPMRSYSENNALQSLLTGGPPYCNKDTVPGQGHEPMTQRDGGIHNLQSLNQSHSHNQNHNHTHDHTQNNSHGSIHDQNTTHHQGHKLQANLDYSHIHKPHPAHDSYIPSHKHSHSNKGNPSNDHNSRSSQSHMQSQNPNNHPHTPMHRGPHPQAFSLRVSTGILQPYSLNTSYHFGPRPHLPTSPSLPPNPAGIINIPQDPCHLASAPHPRHQPYPGAHHHGMTNSWHGYYNNNNHQSGNVGCQGQPHNSHGRMSSNLEMENDSNSLDCVVDSTMLNDFMDTESIDLHFDSSLSQGMGMSLGAFALPQPVHTNQSWVPG